MEKIILIRQSSRSGRLTGELVAKSEGSLGIEGKGHQRVWDTEMTEEFKSSKHKLYSFKNFVISERLNN